MYFLESWLKSVPYRYLVSSMQIRRDRPTDTRRSTGRSRSTCWSPLVCRADAIKVLRAACNTHATRIQHACNTHATRIQHTDRSLLPTPWLCCLVVKSISLANKFRVTQLGNQLGTPRGWRVFWGAPNILHYVQ